MGCPSWKHSPLLCPVLVGRSCLVPAEHPGFLLLLQGVTDVTDVLIQEVTYIPVLLQGGRALAAGWTARGHHVSFFCPKGERGRVQQDLVSWVFTPFA